MCLAPDPYADPSVGDGYRVNSLYFDTAGLDVYHRVRSFDRRTFRLRRYGSEPHVFLERKSKSRGLVRKRRTAVPESELVLLTNEHHADHRSDAASLGGTGGGSTEPPWPGLWFHRRLAKRQLGPKTQISYERVARVGMTPEGAIRFTVDRHVRCSAAAGLDVPCIVAGATMLDGQSIVELKFHVAMPALFKDLMYEFSLTPSSVSKYRLSVEACGLNNGHKPASVRTGIADLAAEVLDANVRYA
jgi:hypothetical protein